MLYIDMVDCIPIQATLSILLTNDNKGLNMSTLTIIANITAKDDSIALVKAELEKLIPPTRDEEGCLGYNLFQDNENPAHFMFHESWATRELWQIHMENQHLKEFSAATEGAIESFILNEMTEIG